MVKSNENNVDEIQRFNDSLDWNTTADEFNLTCNEGCVSKEYGNMTSMYSFMRSVSRNGPSTDFDNTMIDSDTRASTWSIDMVDEPTYLQRRQRTFVPKSFEVSICPSAQDLPLVHPNVSSFCTNYLMTKNESRHPPMYLSVGLIKMRVFNQSNPVLAVSPMAMTNGSLVFIGCDLNSTYLVVDAMHKEQRHLWNIIDIPPIYNLLVYNKDIYCLCGSEYEFYIKRICYGPTENDMAQVMDVASGRWKDTYAAVVPCEESFLLFGASGRIDSLNLSGVMKKLSVITDIQFGTITHSRTANHMMSFCAKSSTRYMLGVFEEDTQRITYDWIPGLDVGKPCVALFGPRLVVIDRRNRACFVYQDGWMPALLGGDQTFVDILVDKMIPKDGNVNIFVEMNGSSASIFEIKLLELSIITMMEQYLALDQMYCNEIDSTNNKRPSITMMDGKLAVPDI